jgi:hypothetical protein
MTTSREVCRHFLVSASSAKDNNKLGSWLVVVPSYFSLVVEDNNKPLGSLSFFTFFSLGAKNNKFNNSSSSPSFFPQVQKMMTSQDPSSSLSLVVLL